MSRSGRSAPTSLNELLETSRDHFEELFSVQMAGGVAGREKARKRDDPAMHPKRRADGSQETPNATAELNRRFGLDWASKTLRHDFNNGRISAEVAISAGGMEIVETGTSTLRENENQDDALQRAVDRALKHGASRLSKPSSGQSGQEPTAVSQSGEMAVQVVDAVTVNRLHTTLANLCLETKSVLSRNAVSPGFSSPEAVSTAIMDSQANMISGTSGSFLAHLLKDWQLHLGSGDVLLQSDPYGSAGTSRGVNEWTLVAPVFQGVDLVGYVSVQAWLVDVGGGAEGSNPADATSVFDEGIRVPPVKIIEAGRLNAPVLDLVLNNCRTPKSVRADFMAMIEACRAGAAEVANLQASMGPEFYHRACTALRDRTRNTIRDLIVANLPEEPQSFEDVIDDDGCGNGPFQLRLTVWREGDHAYFDWTGTSAQAPGPVNLFLHVGLAKSYVGQILTGTLGRDLASDDGYYDLIHVTVPKGSILAPTFPAAVGRHQQTLARHMDVLNAAMWRHDPTRLWAAGSGPAPVFEYSGPGFRLVDSIPQGSPGRCGRNGSDAFEAVARSLEDLEIAYPVVIERYRGLPNSGGAGLFRGGNGVEKIYRVLSDGWVTLHDDRQIVRPWGVNGGRPGTRSEKWIERADGGKVALPSKIERLAVSAGDRIGFITAGGGGFGDALSRDMMDVVGDLAMGLITAEDAAGEYGIVVNMESMRLERDASEQLRAGLRREKQSSKLVDRGEPA